MEKFGYIPDNVQEIGWITIEFVLNIFVLCENIFFIFTYYQLITFQITFWFGILHLLFFVIAIAMAVASIALFIAVMSKNVSFLKVILLVFVISIFINILFIIYWTGKDIAVQINYICIILEGIVSTFIFFQFKGLGGTLNLNLSQNPQNQQQQVQYNNDFNNNYNNFTGYNNMNSYQPPQQPMQDSNNYTSGQPQSNLILEKPLTESLKADENDK